MPTVLCFQFQWCMYTMNLDIGSPQFWVIGKSEFYQAVGVGGRLRDAVSRGGRAALPLPLGHSFGRCLGSKDAGPVVLSTHNFRSGGYPRTGWRSAVQGTINLLLIYEKLRSTLNNGQRRRRRRRRTAYSRMPPVSSHQYLLSRTEGCAGVNRISPGNVYKTPLNTCLRKQCSPFHCS